MGRPYVYLSEMREYVFVITTGGAHVTNSRTNKGILVRVDSMPLDAFKALMLLYNITTIDAEGTFSDSHIWLDSQDLLRNTSAWMGVNGGVPPSITSIIGST